MMNIEQIWPEWHAEKAIGRGSYGTVYKCFKDTDGGKEYSAIKVISVPQDDFEAMSVDSEGMSVEQSQEYYKDIVDDFLSEIKILESLKGIKNIVDIQDSKVVEKDDGIGWQIFIRMELLTDFNTYASDKKFSEEDTVKLAQDLCAALIACGEKKIIHRDIKPENIFVDAEGNFKLGDFGVAKQLEKTYASMSRKGTYNYMAPEILAAKKYNSRADIYSLGIVMYKLLNNNRLPFIDPDKQVVRYSERQEAFEKRIRGDAIPPLKNIKPELNDIILKACAFKPEERYQTVEAFQNELDGFSRGRKKRKSKNKIKKVGQFFKKHKFLSVIAVLLVIAIIIGSVKILIDKRSPAAVMKELTPYPVKTFSCGQYIAAVDGKGIIGDLESLRFIDENTESKTVISNDDYYSDSIIFDGNTAYQLSDTGNVYSIDVSKQERKLVFSNEYIDSLVYFDSNYIYYLDKGEESEEGDGETLKTLRRCRFDGSDDFGLSAYNVISGYTDQIGDKFIYVYESSEDDCLMYVFDSDVSADLPGKYICADDSSIYYYGEGSDKNTVYRQPVSTVSWIDFSKSESVCEIENEKAMELNEDGYYLCSPNLIVTNAEEGTNSDGFVEYHAQIFDLYTSCTYKIDFLEASSVYALNERYVLVVSRCDDTTMAYLDVTTADSETQFVKANKIDFLGNLFSEEVITRNGMYFSSGDAVFMYARFPFMERD